MSKVRQSRDWRHKRYSECSSLEATPRLQARSHVCPQLGTAITPAVSIAEELPELDTLAWPNPEEPFRLRLAEGLAIHHYNCLYVAGPDILSPSRVASHGGRHLSTSLNSCRLTLVHSNRL